MPEGPNGFRGFSGFGRFYFRELQFRRSPPQKMPGQVACLYQQGTICGIRKIRGIRSKLSSWMPEMPWMPEMRLSHYMNSI